MREKTNHKNSKLGKCHSEEPEATRNHSLGLRFLMEPVLSTAEGFEMTIMELGNGVVPSPRWEKSLP